MTMLKGYGHMVDFFTSFDWWKTAPHDELVDSGKYCLAEPGRTYAVYLPQGGKVTVRLETGTYETAWWNPRTGERIVLPKVIASGTSWTSPSSPGDGDWALLLRRTSN